MNKTVGICLRVAAVLAIGTAAIGVASPAKAAFYGYGYRGYYGPRVYGYGYRYPFYYGYPAYYGYPYAYGPPVYPRVVYAPPVVVVAPPAPAHPHPRAHRVAARRALPSCIQPPGAAPAAPLQGPLPPQG